MDADAAAAQPRRVDPGRLAIFLDHAPGRLAVEVPPYQPQAVGTQRAEEGALPVILDAGLRHVGQHGPRGIKQDLPPLLVPLLGDTARRRPSRSTRRATSTAASGCTSPRPRRSRPTSPRPN